MKMRLHLSYFRSFFSQSTFITWILYTNWQVHFNSITRAPYDLLSQVYVSIAVTTNLMCRNRSTAWPTLSYAKKISSMGVDSAWFLSYLSDRKQCVKTNNETSSFSQIERSEPQGSLLWPLSDRCYSNATATIYFYWT